MQRNALAKVHEHVGSRGLIALVAGLGRARPRPSLLRHLDLLLSLDDIDLGPNRLDLLFLDLEQCHLAPRDGLVVDVALRIRHLAPLNALRLAREVLEDLCLLPPQDEWRHHLLGARDALAREEIDLSSWRDFEDRLERVAGVAELVGKDEREERL